MIPRALLVASLQGWGIVALLRGLTQFLHFVREERAEWGFVDSPSDALRGQYGAESVILLLAAGFVLWRAPRIARWWLPANVDVPTPGLAPTRRAARVLVGFLVCVGALGALGANLMYPLPGSGANMEFVPGDRFSHATWTALLTGLAGFALVSVGWPRPGGARSAPATGAGALSPHVVRAVGALLVVWGLQGLAIALAWLASAQMPPSWPWEVYALPLLVGVLLLRRFDGIGGLLDRSAAAPGPSEAAPLDLAALRAFGLCTAGWIAAWWSLGHGLGWVLGSNDDHPWIDRSVAWGPHAFGVHALLALALLLGPRRILRALRGLPAGSETFGEEPVPVALLGPLLRAGLGLAFLAGALGALAKLAATEQPSWGEGEWAVAAHALVAALAAIWFLVRGLPAGFLRAAPARPAFLLVGAFLLVLDVATPLAMLVREVYAKPPDARLVLTPIVLGPPWLESGVHLLCATVFLGWALRPRRPAPEPGPAASAFLPPGPAPDGTQP